MRILITGGYGFVGAHFVEHVLVNTNWEIIILDRLSYAGNMNRITDIRDYNPERVKTVFHDLRAPISDMTDKMIGNVDYVVHFAAESHVDRSLENAIPFAMSNVVGTTHLLEWLKKRWLNGQKIKRYIGFNTDEVFGPAPEDVFYKEGERFKPSNPYSASKAGQWAMEYAFATFSGLPISMVHSMNIIGERQHPEKFVPKTIKTLLEGKRVVLHGINDKNQSSRCWIHARNVADALLFLLERAKTGESYNIVGEERTVYEMANWICESVLGRELKDSDIIWLDFHSARPGHDKRYALDGSKLEQLGWKPPVILRKSLKKVVKWSLKNRNWL